MKKLFELFKSKPKEQTLVERFCAKWDKRNFKFKEVSVLYCDVLDVVNDVKYCIAYRFISEKTIEGISYIAMYDPLYKDFPHIATEIDLSEYELEVLWNSIVPTMHKAITRRKRINRAIESKTKPRGIVERLY